MGKHWGSFYVCAFFNDHRGAEPFRTALLHLVTTSSLINKAPERPEAIRAQATAIPPSCIGCHGTMPWPSGTGSWPHQVSPLASADHCGPRRRQPCGLQASRAVCRRAVSGKRRDDGGSLPWATPRLMDGKGVLSQLDFEAPRAFPLPTKDKVPICVEPGKALTPLGGLDSACVHPFARLVGWSGPQALGFSLCCMCRSPPPPPLIDPVAVRTAPLLLLLAKPRSLFRVAHPLCNAFATLLTVSFCIPPLGRRTVCDHLVPKDSPANFGSTNLRFVPSLGTRFQPCHGTRFSTPQRRQRCTVCV